MIDPARSRFSGIGTVGAVVKDWPRHANLAGGEAWVAEALALEEGVGLADFARAGEAVDAGPFITQGRGNLLEAFKGLLLLGG